MKQFNLEEWLQDKSIKVVTREGKDVEIIYTNSPVPHHPIVGFIDKSIYTWTIDGKPIYGKEEQDKNDLFFAEEEDEHQSKELTEFETGLLDFADEWEDAEIDSKILNNLLKKHSKILIDLARKEIESKTDQNFADEEEELTEFQKNLEEDCDCYVNLYNDGKTREELREWIKAWCPRILDLARKEIEKSIEDGAIEFAKSYMGDVNPSFEKVQESEELWKWKMSCLRGINKAYKQGKEDALKDLPKLEKSKGAAIDPTIPVVYTYAVSNKTYVEYDGYRLCINDAFEKLPKNE